MNSLYSDKWGWEAGRSVNHTACNTLGSIKEDASFHVEALPDCQ